MKWNALGCLLGSFVYAVTAVWRWQMRAQHRGMTLVEVLVVVVALLIIASLALPQMARASDRAIKDGLSSKTNMINAQIEAFRVDNNGLLPEQVAGSAFLAPEANQGWAALVDLHYLYSVPVNDYNGSGLISPGGLGAASSASRLSELGWCYDADPLSTNHGVVFAGGFYPDEHALAHEQHFPGTINQ